MEKTISISKVLKRGFLVLWATAIFWFYLGNLINFHQNRIWGKVLIPACFTHSSVNNKGYGSIEKINNDSSSTLYEVEFDALEFEQFISISDGFTQITVIDWFFDDALVPSPVLNENCLRGPPVA